MDLRGTQRSPCEAKETDSFQRSSVQKPPETDLRLKKIGVTTANFALRMDRGEEREECKNIPKVDWDEGKTIMKDREAPLSVDELERLGEDEDQGIRELKRSVSCPLISKEYVHH